MVVPLTGLVVETCRPKGSSLLVVTAPLASVVRTTLPSASYWVVATGLTVVPSYSLTDGSVVVIWHPRWS